MIFSKSRKENLERAIQHESSGNLNAAFECYQKAVDISPSIAVELIQVLRQEKVEYIVAPYEADAQMAFLSINERVEAIITEDSDLIPFGCTKIIFKMDKYGDGLLFQHEKLQQNRELNFIGFTKQMLLEMCILSGCDYLQSLPGMGPKRAHAMVQRLKCHKKIIKHLRYNGMSVPPSYEEDFKKAIWTFRHQRVYDPSTEDIVHLSEPPAELDLDLEFLGPIMPQNIAKGIARGELDPFTKVPFQGEMRQGLDKYIVKAFQPQLKKQMVLPVQKNVMTNYFCLASVEAKRKFKAPRIRCKQNEELEESSQNTDDHLSNTSDLTRQQTSGTNCIFKQPLVELKSIKSRGHFNHSAFTSRIEDIIGAKDEILDLAGTGKTKEVKSKFGAPVTPDSNMSTQQFLTSKCAPPSTIEESHVHKSVSDEFAIKEKQLKRKVITRSPYFTADLSDENCGVLNTGHNIDEECAEKMIKPNPAHKIRKSLARATCRQTDHSLNTASDQVSNHLVQQISCNKSLPCDISHLEEYSYIAEKSMERFLSIMSSFKGKASGCRASGLRPPLKDVKNACQIMKNVGSQDFSKFMYVPKHQKPFRNGLEKMMLQ
ncbi:exonuclease 1 isoform X2 [Nymphaea colorata]|uniref:exonuclease 1 isoform X2 n=1 Tax=Nymphaea colorata TaxID=210225 RepID=UPI00214EA91C|nr:exonuclease 1 isoform X2 [Nymphaea colorata]